MSRQMAFPYLFLSPVTLDNAKAANWLQITLKSKQVSKKNAFCRTLLMIPTRISYDTDMWMTHSFKSRPF